MDGLALPGPSVLEAAVDIAGCKAGSTTRDPYWMLASLNPVFTMEYNILGIILLLKARG